MLDLQKPRHISTLPKARCADCSPCTSAVPQIADDFGAPRKSAEVGQIRKCRAHSDSSESVKIRRWAVWGQLSGLAASLIRRAR
jgi:hypothetical protein